MKSYLLLIPVILLTLFSCNSNNNEKQGIESFYAEIDEEIKKVPEYDAEKEKRINNIKQRIEDTGSWSVKKELTDWLISEYEAYESDSALKYININLANPEVKADKLKEHALLIKEADLAAHAGLFGESETLLKNIDKTLLDSVLLESYYSAYCDLYQYQSEYAIDSEYARKHERLREIYIDSVRQYAPKNSINYLINYAAAQNRKGNFSEAETLLLKNIDKYSSGDRNYSILASILADIYKQKGENNNYIKYIGESVKSDLRGAIKENMAMRALATERYEAGDLERAERYLRQSFSDANFYSARMRNAQSSRMLPIIGEAYANKQKSHTHQLRLLIIFISILAFCFIIISVFALIQIRKVRSINKKTNQMLDEVSGLSKKLSQVNNELSETNIALQSSNAIKEQYALLFMDYCSMAISSLQKYQQSLKVSATQGSLSQLLKKIESGNVESKTLAEFYAKFDEAILNIYPNFVEKFNILLKPGEQISLKPNESLNTELRVFALIRLGVRDAERIAKFLRCSVTTVYTYRSKIKKRAIDPENFEKELEKI